MALPIGVGLALLLVLQQPARTPDIHFSPTRHNIADAMLKLADVKPEDVVYDLGSGDGRIPIIAAQKYGAKAVGIEIDPRLVEISWQIANQAEVANRVSFVVGDLFEADLSKATVVTNSAIIVFREGLEAVLKVAREAVEAAGSGGRVICVFGAAGDRDGAKRPLMGRVASRLADRAIVTTDDAYSEDPARIAREVVAGADAGRRGPGQPRARRARPVR